MIEHTHSKFGYSLGRRIFQLFPPYLFLIIFGTFLLLYIPAYFWALLGGNLPSWVSIDTSSFTFVYIIFTTILSILGAISGLSMYPIIETTPEGFRITTPLYNSGWLSWYDITQLSKPVRWGWSFENHFVTSNKLPLYFIVTGLANWQFTKSFVISSRIQNYDQLIVILKTKRPDLFPDSTTPQPNKNSANRQ